MLIYDDLAVSGGLFEHPVVRIVVKEEMFIQRDYSLLLQ